MFEELKRKIDSVSTISFDVFDTLLLRNIYQPKDIFKILSREFASELGAFVKPRESADGRNASRSSRKSADDIRASIRPKESPESESVIDDFPFVKLRVIAERESRTPENNYETTLDEIYKTLEKLLKNPPEGFVKAANSAKTTEATANSAESAETPARTTNSAATPSSAEKPSEKSAATLAKAANSAAAEAEKTSEKPSEKSPASLVRKIKARELELEERFLTANPFMLRVFNYCLKKRKKIYLISNMYLDSDFLNKILKRAGYKNYKLFVSGEEKVSKTRGLFKRVQESEQLDFSDWLHSGDSKIADVDAPRALGINAYHYKNVRDRSRIKTAPKSIELSILRGLENNCLYANASGKKPDFWTEFGVAFASPIYFGFTFWLYQLTKNDSVPLYFIARDGYLPMQVYEKIANHENLPVQNARTAEFAKPAPASKSSKSTKTALESTANAPKTAESALESTAKTLDYLRLSRATAVVPTFDELEPDPTISLVNWVIGLAESNENKIDLTSVFSNYDLDPKKYTPLLKQFGIKSVHEKINYDNHHKFQNFIRYIYPDIKIVLARRRDLLKKYLHKHKVDEQKKFYIVDVGWQCSVQRSLEHLVDTEIYGFYFGTDRPVKAWHFPNSLGWFIDHGRPDSYRGKILPKFCMMYEFLFTAPEGTALRFEERAKEASIEEPHVKTANAAFAESAQNAESAKSAQNAESAKSAESAESAQNAKSATSANTVDAVLDDRESYTPIVEKFQSAALEIIDRYLDYFEFFESFDPGETVSPYENFLYAHKYEDVLNFAALDASVSINNTKTPFVVRFSKDYIYENFSLTHYKDLVDESLKSLWPYTYIVDECKTNADFDAFQKEYSLRKVATSSLANQTNLRKLFTNPRKGISIIKTWLTRNRKD